MTTQLQKLRQYLSLILQKNVQQQLKKPLTEKEILALKLIVYGKYKPEKAKQILKLYQK